MAGGSCTTQNLVWRSRQVMTRQETPTQKKRSELSTIAGYVARVGRTTERLSVPTKCTVPDVTVIRFRNEDRGAAQPSERRPYERRSS